MHHKLIQTRNGVIRLSYSEEAIRLHRLHKGKIAITPKVSLESMEDLSLAYSPGVAAVSMAIANDIRESYQLTNRANTVASDKQEISWVKTIEIRTNAIRELFLNSFI